MIPWRPGAATGSGAQLPRKLRGTLPWVTSRVAEQALTAVLQEAYVQGISTRSVDVLVEALGMVGL